MNNPTFASLRLTVLACLVFISAGSAVAQPDAADRAVLKKLNDPITITGDQLSLEVAIASIAEQIGVKAKVDWPTLEIVGIEKDAVVWLNLDQVAAEHALQTALAHASAEAFDDDRLGYAVMEGELAVSTRRMLKTFTNTQKYDLKKYIAAARGRVDVQELVDHFVELISTTVGDPDEWLDEESTLAELNGKLIIKTTAENHAEIQALFDKIDHPVDSAKDVEVQEDRATRAKLEKRISLNTDNLTLGTAIDFIQAVTELNVAVNWRSLEIVGIEPDALVSIAVTRVPAAQLLQLVLDQVSADAFDDDKAGFAVRDGVVHIATLREHKGNTHTQVYKLSKWIGNKATDQESVDEVAQAIHTLVGDPDEWLDEESTLTPFFGLLVVKTTPENHQALAKLLGNLER